MGLSELELIVVSTKAMRFSRSKAMTYLDAHDYKISVRQYNRILKNVSENTRKNAFEIGKNFLEDHMEVIYELENNKRLMYEDYFAEPDRFKRAMIMVKITETMTPYISAYKEATQSIIEKVKKEIVNEEENIDLPINRN